MQHSRRACGLLALLLTTAVVAFAPPTAARGAPRVPAPAGCATGWSPTYRRLNPRTGVDLITPSRAEAVSSVDLGFTVDRGAVFSTARRPGRGLAAVHRLRQPRSGDQVWMASPAEIRRAVRRYHYVDDGVDFWAATRGGSCLQPVTRLLRAGIHRQTASSAEVAALVHAGWRRETTSFYVARTVYFRRVEPQFMFVAFPDTQQEDHNPADPRFANRTQYLVDHKSALDVRFVAQVGDLVDWDTPDHIQYQIAQRAMSTLTAGAIPFALTVGNHDGAATCPGGSACPGVDVHLAIRDTHTLNAYFQTPSLPALAGEYETGKLDNAYYTFTVAGQDFLVLSLELWPRAQMVRWAKAVVASHPSSNVIVTTHSYLTSTGLIGTSSSYGDTSPQYLYDNLIKVYPNVKMVLSGHTGLAAARIDTGLHGNRIVSFLQTFHDNHTNPMRMIEIDAQNGTVRSWVHCPYTNTDYTQYATKVAPIAWI